MAEAQQQQQQKSWYIQSAHQISVKPGQKVLVVFPNDNNTLLAKWQGPFEILKKLWPTTYQVSTLGRPSSSRILHINLLKKWVQRKEKVQVQSTAERKAQRCWRKWTNNIYLLWVLEGTVTLATSQKTNSLR